MNPRQSSQSPFQKSSGGENLRINNRIRAREVRVIAADGSQLGIMDTRRALEMAQAQGLDLAEISANSTPPVCKIMDYGKYKYQQKKKAKISKKNQVVVLLKEVQFRPHTDTHDIEFKVKHILRFLSEGNKVKVSIRFRGREASHSELGYALANRIVDTVGTAGMVEQPPKMEGKVLYLIVAPNTKMVGAKKEKNTSHNPSTNHLSTNLGGKENAVRENAVKGSVNNIGSSSNSGITVKIDPLVSGEKAQEALGEGKEKE